MFGPPRRPGIVGGVTRQIRERVQETAETIKETGRDRVFQLILDHIQEPMARIKEMNLPIEDTLQLLRKVLADFEVLVMNSIPNELQSREQALVHGEAGLSGFETTWAALEEKSRNFLKTGELLYSYLGQAPSSSGRMVDYSPVTLEFSKAFENEIYTKIFQRSRVELKNLLGKDRMNQESLRGTYGFKMDIWDMLSKYLEKNDPHLELGRMKTILQALRSQLVQRSLIFQRLRAIVDQDWGGSVLDGVKDRPAIDACIGDIIELRNDSAHKN